MKGSEIIKKLKSAGCTLKEHGKRHDLWYSPLTKKTFPVPRHKAEVATGTANSILKDAGVK